MRATDHEFSWRIERRGRAFADENEGKHTPKRNRSSDRYHDDPRDLRGSHTCGPDNARPPEESSGYVDRARKEEANKKRSVSYINYRYQRGYRCAAHDLISFFFRESLVKF